MSAAVSVQVRDIVVEVGSERRYNPLRRKDGKKHSQPKFDPIKHVSIASFGDVMGIAGLGVLWGRTAHVFSIPNQISEAAFIFGGACFFIVLVLYVLRTIRYGFRKILKEWDDPIMSQFFAAFFTCFLLFSTACTSWDTGNGANLNAAKALFWCGSIGQIVLGIVLPARWILHPISIEYVSPLWTVPIGGNLVASLAAVLSAPTAYREAAWIWFANGFFLWIMLTPIFLLRYMAHPTPPDQALPSVWVLLASPGVATSAYSALVGGFDSFSRFLYFVGFFTFFICLAVCIFGKHYRVPFGQHYYAMTFPLEAFATSAIDYYVAVPSQLTKAQAFIFIAFGTAVPLLIILMTAYKVITRSGIFLPPPKPDPLIFLTLVRKALQSSLKTLRDEVTRATDGKAWADLSQHFSALTALTEAYGAMHRLVCKLLVAPLSIEELPFEGPELCKHDKELVLRQMQLLSQPPSANQDAEQLRAALLGRMDEVEGHISPVLEQDEDIIPRLSRRFLSLDRSRTLTRLLFEAVEPAKWPALLPHIVTHLAPPQQVGLLKALHWAVPEWTQYCGAWLWSGVGAGAWKRLSGRVPEIVPAGLPGHFHIR